MNAPDPLAPILWFQGPPLSGKTTLSQAVQAKLEQEGVASLVLDTNELTTGVNADDPSAEEAIRRTAEMAKLMARKGWVTLVAADCVTEAEQDQLWKVLAGTQRKIILMDCPDSVLEARAEELGQTWSSPKGQRFKVKADLVLKSHVHTPDACLERVLALVASLLHREEIYRETAHAHGEGEGEETPRGRPPLKVAFTPNWEELRSLSQIRAKNERPEDHMKRKRPPPEPELWMGMSGAMLLNIVLLVAGALGLGYLISQVRENYERAKQENGALEQTLRVQRVLEKGPTQAPAPPKKED